MAATSTSTIHGMQARATQQVQCIAPTMYGFIPLWPETRLRQLLLGARIDSALAKHQGWRSRFIQIFCGERAIDTFDRTLSCTTTSSEFVTTMPDTGAYAASLDSIQDAHEVIRNFAHETPVISGDGPFLYAFMELELGCRPCTHVPYRHNYTLFHRCSGARPWTC